jgi:hypothetical protein
MCSTCTASQMCGLHFFFLCLKSLPSSLSLFCVSFSCLFLTSFSRVSHISLSVPHFFSSFCALFSVLCFLCFVFFFSSCFLFPMHTDNFDNEEFDVGTLCPNPSNGFRLQYGIEEDNFSNYSVDPPVLQCQLRSRPPIDFSLQQPTFDYPPSHMSGLMAHSTSNSFMLAPKVAHLADLSSRPSVELLASLTISELCHNAHYCKLCDNYDYTSWVLACYLGKDLRVGEPCVLCSLASNMLVPDMYRGMLFQFVIRYTL